MSRGDTLFWPLLVAGLALAYAAYWWFEVRPWRF